MTVTAMRRGRRRRAAFGPHGLAHGLAIARTMGMVTIGLFVLFFSIESTGELESAFSLDTFSGRTFRITTGVSFVLLIPVHRPGHLPDRD